MKYQVINLFICNTVIFLLTHFFLIDHIILDVDTNVLSFTYKDIDSCIDKFLIDWERIFMMANLSRQGKK